MQADEGVIPEDGPDPTRTLADWMLGAVAQHDMIVIVHQLRKAWQQQVTRGV